MSDPYIGEIQLLPYPRGAPMGWQLCDGSLLAISQYDILFMLIGTTYGGDGVSSFGVPDLRGRVPIHQGTGTGLSTYALGQTGGTETVTLTLQQMASHTHFETASTVPGTSTSPQNNVTAALASETFYAVAGDDSTAYPLPSNTIGVAGGGQGHENVAPTLTLNYCIAWQGIFPQQQ